MNILLFELVKPGIFGPREICAPEGLCIGFPSGSTENEPSASVDFVSGNPELIRRQSCQLCNSKISGVGVREQPGRNILNGPLQ